MTAVYVAPTVEHLVMVGPDWWGCICWQSDGDVAAVTATVRGERHADLFGAAMVTTDWAWGDVSAVGTPDEVHRWLWESGEFT